MTDFRFIADDKLRNAIERDKKELEDCLRNQNCKSTLLLAGSIIEAVLVDYFLAFPKNLSESAILRANLNALIDWAEQEQLISQQTKELSTVIRNYRNLIHPGKEYRLSERVDIHTATVAASLVEIITEEIADNYAKKLGYTAEQAIKKVTLDPSFSAIFDHVVEKMAPVERVKLFRVIPSICNPQNHLETVTNSFITLHYVLKGKISENILRFEVNKVYEYIHTSSKLEAVFYLRFFASDLDLLESDQRIAVVDYCLNLLISSEIEELETYLRWKIFSTLGGYLNNVKGEEKAKDVFFAFSDQPDSYDEIFLKIMVDLLSAMSLERARQIIAGIRKMFWLSSRSIKWADNLETNLPPF